MNFQKTILLNAIILSALTAAAPSQAMFHRGVAEPTSPRTAGAHRYIDQVSNAQSSTQRRILNDTANVLRGLRIDLPAREIKNNQREFDLFKGDIKAAVSRLSSRQKEAFIDGVKTAFSVIESEFLAANQPGTQFGYRPLHVDTLSSNFARMSVSSAAAPLSSPMTTRGASSSSYTTTSATEPSVRTAPPVAQDEEMPAEFLQLIALFDAEDVARLMPLVLQLKALEEQDDASKDEEEENRVGLTLTQELLGVLEGYTPEKAWPIVELIAGQINNPSYEYVTTYSASGVQEKTERMLAPTEWAICTRVISTLTALKERAQVGSDLRSQYRALIAKFDEMRTPVVVYNASSLSTSKSSSAAMSSASSSSAPMPAPRIVPMSAYFASSDYPIGQRLEANGLEFLHNDTARAFYERTIDPRQTMWTLAVARCNDFIHENPTPLRIQAAIAALNALTDQHKDARWIYEQFRGPITSFTRLLREQQ